MTTTYAEYAHPLWRRLLLTRETGIVAVVVAVILYSMA
jgi:rhamnose transport system permease protein